MEVETPCRHFFSAALLWGIEDVDAFYHSMAELSLVGGEQVANIHATASSDGRESLMGPCIIGKIADPGELWSWSVL